MPKPVIRTNFFLVRFLGELLYLSPSCYASHFLFMAAIAFDDANSGSTAAVTNFIPVVIEIAPQSPPPKSFTPAESRQRSNMKRELFQNEDGVPLSS